jgi:NAD-dependent dihydropyrimidine dehydrogenase PreA subunit
MNDRRKMLREGLRRMLLCPMPDDMRASVERLAARENPSEYELKSALMNWSKRLVLARPREEIAWNPTVNVKACIGCATCAHFCPHQVYEMIDGKAAVIYPAKCVILCSNCMPLCPTQAIGFPPQRDFVELLKYE